MLLQEPFKAGRLWLENTPSTDAAVTVAGMPVLFVVLAVASILAAILFLPRFLGLVPLLLDSLFRARGSVSLENSVRASNDRRLIASLLLLPAALLTYRYRLYDAAFLRDLTEGWRLMAVMGVILAYAMLRLMLYKLLKPRRNNDFYRLARRTGYTYFILMTTVALIGSGITGFVFLFPMLSALTRRLHDTSHSGWWVAIFAILGLLYYASYSIIMWPIRDQLDLGNDPYAMIETITNAVQTTPVAATIASICSLPTMILALVIFIFSLIDSKWETNKYGPSPKYQ